MSSVIVVGLDDTPSARAADYRRGIRRVFEEIDPRPEWELLFAEGAGRHDGRDQAD